MKKNAFTLAEVLITLAIIGVVAAMTIPTLMQNTFANQYKTGFKKSYSMLRQAIGMNMAQNGYDFSVLEPYRTGTTTKTNSNGKTTTTDDVNTAKHQMKDIIVANFDAPVDRTSAYFKSAGSTQTMQYGSKFLTCTEANVVATLANGKANTTACKGREVGEVVGNNDASGFFTLSAGDFLVYSLNDGTIIGFHKDAHDCVAEATAVKNHCVGFFDVNGMKGPNIVISKDATKNAEIQDIMPIYFYGSTISPGNDAVRKVLNDEINS